MSRGPGDPPRTTSWAWLVVGLTIVGAIGLPLLGLRVFHGSDLMLGHDPWRYHAAIGERPTERSQSDTVDVALPTRAVVRERMLGGDYPLWNELPAGGAPLGSGLGGGLPSPISLPYWLAPLWYAPALSKLLELSVAIGFTFLFLRRIGLTPPATIAGGLIFGFSAFQVVWTNWAQTHVGALIPAVFWAVEVGLAGETRRSFIWLSLITAFILLAGFPPVAGFALLAAGLYALARMGARRGVPLRRRARPLPVLAAAVLLGVGLASLQLLPFAYHTGARDLDYRIQTPEGHLPVQSLATMVAPNAFGSPVEGNYFGPPPNYIEIQSFIGATALALLAVAAVTRRRMRAVPGSVGFLWGGALVSGVLIYLGGPLLAALQTLPLFKLNSVGRLRSVLGFLLASLAAVALDALSRRHPDLVGRAHRTLRILAVVGVAAVGMAVAIVTATAADAAADAQHTRHFAGQLILPTVAGVGVLVASIVAMRAGNGRRHALLWVVPPLIAMESLAFVVPFWPRIPKHQFYPETATHRFLHARLGADRLAASGQTLMPGTTTLYGLRSVTAHVHHPTTLKEILRAADPGVFDASPTFSMLHVTEEVAASPILDRLAARYLVMSPTDEVFGRTRRWSDSDGRVSLTSGRELRAEIPLLGLRAVTLQVQDRDLSGAAPTYLDVRLLDGSEVVGLGSRRLDLDQLSDSVTIPVSEPGAQQIEDRGSVGIAEMRLRGPAGSIALDADASGDPAISVTQAGGDDGLRLVFAGDTVIYGRMRALPRIRWASRIRVEPSPSRRVDLLADGLPDDTVLLDRAGPAPGGDGAAEIRLRRDGGDRLEIQVKADDAGYLVVGDAMQRGWRARLDGRDVPLHHADHALVAVSVPPGRHAVNLVYDPRGWAAGRMVSGVSALILLGVVAWPRSRRRTRNRRSASSALP